MEVKEIKTCASNLEKAKDDETILKLLNILEKNIKPTEQLLRVSLQIKNVIGLKINGTNSLGNKSWYYCEQT